MYGARMMCLALVASCAAPLTVAEDRSGLDGGATGFDPRTPSDGSRDALDEPVSLGDPTDGGID